MTRLKNQKAIPLNCMAASKTSAQALQAENQKLHREIEALKQQLKKLEHDNRESNEGIQMLFNDLYKKHQKLQVIDKLKSDFISTVSHELKTPLTMIKAGISQVHDGVLGDVTQDQKEALDGVLEGVNRLTHIVSEVLDISKLEGGKVRLKKQTVHASELIEKVLKPSALKANVKSVRVMMDTAVGPDQTLVCDPGKIIQVLTNLVDNAIKFTPKDGRVTVGARTDAKNFEFYVQDTGIGIDKQDISKLFVKFQQFERAEPLGHQHGTGLGLAICKEIIELHGGKIWAESELNHGAAFHFTIPQ